MKKNNKVKKEIIKCSFCNKIINKKQYRVKDKYNSYVICDVCNDKVKKYQNEYNKESQKAYKEYCNKLETVSNHLRKKYNLKIK